MTKEAQSQLWALQRKLDPCDKSRPPALTDVFVAKARNTTNLEGLDEIIQMTLAADVSPIILQVCVISMHEVGSINTALRDYLLEKIPDEK